MNESLVASQPKQERFAAAEKQYVLEQKAKAKLQDAARGPLGKILAKLLETVSSDEDVRRIASEKATPLPVRLLQKLTEFADYSLFPYQSVGTKLPDGSKVQLYEPTAKEKSKLGLKE